MYGGVRVSLVGCEWDSRSQKRLGDQCSFPLCSMCYSAGALCEGITDPINHSYSHQSLHAAIHSLHAAIHFVACAVHIRIQMNGMTPSLRSGELAKLVRAWGM